MTGTATDGAAGRVAFTITVPDSWYELDLSPATRAQTIQRLVEDRVHGDDELAQQREAVTRLLNEQAALARDAGATYCASFIEPTEAAPITGAVTVSLVPDPTVGVGGSLSDLLDGFAEVPRTGPGAPYAELTVVELPGAGACPRTSGIQDAEVGEGRYLRKVFMVTAVPVPDLDQIFLVAASSPVLPLADVLLDLFDAVTGTFRVVRADA